MQTGKTLPNHVVIIPDGNRRWARERGLDPWKGHEAGAENTERLIREARRLGIREISFWGSSIENLTKRPLAESKALLRIYETYFSRLAESEEIHADQARIRCIGHWEEQFPDSLKKVLSRCIESTKGYDRYFLNFFLAYSGNDEMRLAFEKVSRELSPGEHINSFLVCSLILIAENTNNVSNCQLSDVGIGSLTEERELLTECFNRNIQSGLSKLSFSFKLCELNVVGNNFLTELIEIKIHFSFYCTSI
jgi:undecaprenyl diphosphate synthase